MWTVAVGGSLALAAGTVAGALAAGSWVTQVVVGLAVAALAAVGCALPLWRTRREVDRLHTAAAAEDRFVAELDDHDAHTAMAAAVEVLVPNGRLVDLYLGSTPATSDSLPDALPRVLVGDALATGRPAVLPDGTTGRETARLIALPIAAGGRRIGAVVLRLRGDADAGVAEVQQLLRRIGPTLAAAAEEASASEVAAANAAEGELRELVARGAHDLRTPLNTLAGMVDTLVRHSDELPAPTREELYGALQRSTRRVAGWIEMLLDAAVDEESRSARPVLTALQPLLEEAVTVTHAATAGLRVEVADTALYVFADPSRVVRVVSNLLANAGHHAGAGDSVEVDARQRGRDVEVSIRDHGAGWAPGEARSTGDGDTHLSGLGLGLQSVREQVASWGGELELDETPGGGATVRFTLPAARAGNGGGDRDGRSGADSAGNWTIAGRESVLRDLHRTP